MNSLKIYFGLLQHDLTHIGLVLFQDNVAWELRLRYRRKLFNDVLQGLQAGHPQLVTVVCGRHEGHADEVRQMEHQLISWIERDGRKNHKDCVRNRKAFMIIVRNVTLVSSHINPSENRIYTRFLFIFNT